MKIAVIADPHFSDIYSYPGRSTNGMALRTFADTAASTRVFNESYHALVAVLDEVARDGLKTVVIVGDLTDDGEAATVRSAEALLADYTARHGIRFFMTPGNHDLYAIHGRHQGKRFLNKDGSSTLVTSDADEPMGSSIAKLMTAEMHCAGYREGLPPLAGLGFFRDPADIHWETPFGQSDALDDRLYTVRSDDGSVTREMVDASYLVEPVDGLWLLSLDANVFEPKNGATDPVPEKNYHDSTDAGWNAMLKHKRFVLDWAADVAARTKAQGKDLLVFSHYPMIDPLSGTLDDEVMIFSDSSFARRAPRPEVVEAGVKSGVGVHFSGHLHVNETEAVVRNDGFLVNIAVPSLVGFPPAYKRVEFMDAMLVVETVPVVDVPKHDVAFSAYRREAKRDGLDVSTLDTATDHFEFLNSHQIEMVRHRYLPKEWPADLASLVPVLTLGDLAALADVREGLDAETVLARVAGKSKSGSGWQSASFFDLVVDWYRLRKGRHLAMPFIAEGRLAAYERLSRQFAAGLWEAGTVQARLAALLRMLIVYAGGHPSENFTIDLATGEVAAADHFGRTERRQIGSA